ncbi:hypothetical protein DOY81_001556 [Sarcophaga bullata]|nr:hypothetical protein DOY81_001556 [Sarcophaga bullata]
MEDRRGWTASDSIMVDNVDVDGGDESEQHKTIDDKHNVAQNFATSTTTTTLAGDVNHQNYSKKSDVLITGNMLHFVTTPGTKISIETTMKTEEDTEVMRIFEGHFNDTFPTTLEATARDTLTINNGKSFKEQLSSSSASALTLPLKDKVNATKSKKQKLQQQQQQQQQKRKAKHRKHKSAKFYSTMFCEGYNIEQRNCNSFECSDDINDLLKFYRKYPTTDETNTASTQTMMMDSNTMAAAVAAAAASSVPTIAGTSSSPATTNSEIDGTAQNNENLNTFTTPINMGYVLNWHNLLNFTIMLTLRVKNDSYTTATIFSIRNTTHNLYLESCKDGLRLYLERDKTTEMLPIKFNLYDYHWHQVAIR